MCLGFPYQPWLIFQVGIAVKPKTSIEVVAPYAALVDTVLIMTVEPGFGGQKFMGDMMSKVVSLFIKPGALLTFN